MDNFIVSARKYRPSSFDMVVGQDSITNTLKNAIKNNHLTQAYLFCGPRGVGKTTCARIFAKTINCTNLKNGTEACEECESCLSFNSLRSFNIHELDAASNNKVDDIRTLTDQVRIPPQIGKYTIYIIDEVHMLSTSAFNAFLKTLEEPPAHAIFILATTEKHKIIPTILSRCQIFDFNRIRIDDIVKRLEYVASKEGINGEPEALHIIAQKADGAMRDALSIFDQLVSFSGNSITYRDVIENLNVLDYEYYFKVVDNALQGNYTGTLLLFNEVIDNGFDGHNFITGLNSHLRDLLVSKDEATVKLLETAPSVRERYRQQAINCSIPFLFNALEAGSACDLAYKNAKNGRLHVELALLRICLTGTTDNQEKKKPDLKSSGSSPEEEVVVPPENSLPETTSESDLHNTTEDQNVKPPTTNTKRPAIAPSAKSVSLKDMLNGDDHSGEKVPELVEDILPDTEPSEFTEANLMGAINRFSDLIEEKSPRMSATLRTIVPVVNGTGIHIPLDNDTQREIFENSFRLKLESYLKKAFSGEDITISTSVEKEVRKDILYTDSQKFDYLSEKNPALKQLRKSFNLDFD